VKNEQGDNLLCRAITVRSPELVQILLDNGFDPKQSKAYGINPMEQTIGAISLWAEILHYLIDRSFSIDEQDKTGLTSLSLAVDFGSSHAARALIMAGDIVNLANYEGIVPMEIAVKKGSTE